MKLGIHIGAFSRPTLEEILDAVAAHGLDCIHFNFKALGMEPMPERIDEQLCRRAARAAAARGLTVCSLSATFNMIHPDPAARREGLARLDTMAAAARLLGATLLTLCTGTRNPQSMWRAHPDNNTPEAWADLTASLEKALAIAERHDAALCIEPEVANVVDSARKARRLLNEMASPRLKIIMDGANLFHRGELPRMKEILTEAFDLLGPDVVLGHAKDLDRDGEAGHLAAGRGLLDYDCYLELFRKIGFTGPLIMHGLAEAEVAGSTAFLRGKLRI